MKKIYIAGPYSLPDPCVNTRNAIQAADELVAAGFAPFIPHLSHFWHTISPKPYQFWIDYDCVFLPLCDAVLRLRGGSPGADRETARAIDLGIPVLYSVVAVAAHFRNEVPT